jgi:hypothetical protein
MGHSTHLLILNTQEIRGVPLHFQPVSGKIFTP